MFICYVNTTSKLCSHLFRSTALLRLLWFYFGSLTPHCLPNLSSSDLAFAFRRAVKIKPSRKSLLSHSLLALSASEGYRPRSYSALVRSLRTDLCFWSFVHNNMNVTCKLCSHNCFYKSTDCIEDSIDIVQNHNLVYYDFVQYLCC